MLNDPASTEKLQKLSDVSKVFGPYICSQAVNIQMIDVIFESETRIIEVQESAQTFSVTEK